MQVFIIIRNQMKLLWNYLKEYKKIFFGALALATVNQVFSLMDPIIFRLIIDDYANKATELSQEAFLRGVILLLLASVGVALVSRIAKNLQDYYVNVITQRLGAQLYANGVEHSFSLPYAAFEDQRSGALLQKLQKARTDIQVLIKSSISVLFLSLIGMIFVITYAFIVHWSIGLVYVLVTPVLAITTFLISKKIKVAQKKIVVEFVELAGATTETLRNVELVKSLGLENQEINRLNTVNDRILDLELEKIKLIRTLSFIQGTLINTTRSLLLLLMLWLIFTQDISIGAFFSLLIYSFFIFNPLTELSTLATQYQEAKASSEELELVLQIPPEKKPAHPKVVKKLQSISLKDVSFSYSSSEKSSLENIDLSIKGGQTIAFVGPSGSGKTTLVKLLVGLYQPLKGNILFNEINSNHLDFEQFRKRIGLVSQSTQLFAGTIRENLLFVNPKATDKDCLKALESAAALSLLDRGKKGLDTKIGEGGIKISGGERQRLAIARALLRQPDLLIFDEATSSLDSITEKSITDTIREVEKGKPNLITILVAHRLSTISHADHIYVLEKGKIIEQGRHQTLLELGGLYTALWRQQTTS